MAKYGRWVMKNGKAGGWAPEPADHRDQIFKGALPRKAITDQVALKDEFLPSIRDQGQLGSCTGHGVRGALMYSLRQKGEVFRKPGYDLSPLFAYYQARALENAVNEDSGAYIRDAVKAANKIGVATEASWPYRPERFTRTPSATALKTAAWHQIKVGYKACLDVDDVLQAISYGIPVVGGFSWFGNSDGPGGHIPMPSPNDSTDQGHCVWFTAGDPRRREFRFQNSWAGDWGDNGYGYMPFAFLERGYADDFWAILHE